MARFLPFLLAGLAFAGQASAQTRDAGRPEGDLLDEHGDDTPREEDPISMGTASELDVPELAPDAGVPTSAPTAPPVASVRGPILAAVPGVRERSHSVEVRLEGGLAVVSETIEVGSGARWPAEVVERLRLPGGARIESLEACIAHACRTGSASPSRQAYDDAVRARPSTRGAPAPVAFAETDADTLVVRAAAVPAGGVLTLHVSWVARTEMHGGVTRFELPARGQDARTATVSVRASAAGLAALTVDGRAMTSEGGGTVEADPWAAVSFTASLPTGAPDGASATTRAGVTSLRAFAAPRPFAARDIVLLVDASPSTEGPARGRMLPSLLSLFAVAPPGTRIRAAAFAARAEPVIATPTDVVHVPTAPLAEAPMADLGHATRLDVAARLVLPWLSDRAAPGRPLVIVVGDGGVADDSTTDDALAVFRRAGVEVAVIALADAPPSAALVRVATSTGGAVVWAAREADAVLHGADDGALVSRIAAVLAPVVARDVVVREAGHTRSLGPLRAGEELVVDTTPALRTTIGAGPLHATLASAPAPVLTTLAALDGAPSAPPAMCDRVGPAFRPSGQSSDAAPVALAEPRCVPPPTTVHAPPPNPLDGRGVPAETVHAMVRDRLIPAARACFRADRHGRAQYSVRAMLAFALRDRELVAQDVSGTLASPLRACLMDALDRLEVPRFEGTVVVRYPLRTEAEAPLEVIELGDVTAHRLDDVLGARASERDVRSIVERH